jgi:hypothetical protein
MNLMRWWTLTIALAVFVLVTRSFVLYRVGQDWIGQAGMVRVASFRQQTRQQLRNAASFSPFAIEIDGGTVRIEFAPGDLDLPATKLIARVSAAAKAVTDYYGRFPVRQAQFLIVPVEDRKGVLSGTSWGTRPTSTRIYLGQLTDDADLKNDWVMTHEMVHYAFPLMPREHHWIEEGIATYVEPIARLEAGELRAAKVWGDLVEGLPYGLPRPGDRGLDHTHTWGRTYWGGAMFCLLADVQIRRETDNRYGLRDALRAIVVAGGNMETTWPLTRALEVGDRAVGVPVLMQMYNQMKTAPVEPDLRLLWRNLGVEITGPTITFDDNAPWAAVRRAIAPDGVANITREPMPYRSTPRMLSTHPCSPHGHGIVNLDSGASRDGLFPMLQSAL